MRHCLDGDGRPGFWDALKREESSAEQDGGTPERTFLSAVGGGALKKALDEARTSCLSVAIVLLFFCNVPYVCIFLPTKEHVNKAGERT